MRKKLFALALCAASTLCASGQQVIDKVVWVVGNEPILLSDVEETRVSYEMQGIPVTNPYCEIPEQIAVQKLYLHQAELDSVEVSEATIKSRVETMLDRYIEAYGSRENVELQAHKTFAQLREDLIQRQREQSMVQSVQQSLVKNIRVTPAEVRARFESLPADSLPLIPDQYELQVITLEPQASPEEVAYITDQLRDMARRVNTGQADFRVLARSYSQDGSASGGGELGFHGKSEWVPEFSNVAFSLTEPGKVSKVVKTQFGYHIIQLVEKRGDKVNVRHILMKPHIDDSEYQRYLVRLDSIGDSIRSGHIDFSRAVLLFSDDKDTRLSDGLMANTDGYDMSSRFALADMSRELARAVDTLQVGEVSRSFIFTNQKHQTVCAIVRLKNRIPAHRATLASDYEALQEMLLNERREARLEEWVREKIRTTYVRIDPDWQGCTFHYDGWGTAQQ